MSAIAMTNRLHQAVRQMPRSFPDDRSAHSYAGKTAWLLLFDQLLCAWLQELADTETAGACTFEHRLDELMNAEHPVGQIRQIAQQAHQHGTWLYSFVLQRRQILSDRMPALNRSDQMIAVQSVRDDSGDPEYEHWLAEFEQALDISRELNQEF